MPIKRYAPEIGKLWVNIAKRCITIAERELYEIYPKTIGIRSSHPEYPYTLDAKIPIQTNAGHAFELSYKALATSQVQGISLKHEILEIHENLPAHIQSEIDAIYVECMKSDNNRSTRNYVEDLNNFLQTMFLDPYIKYGASEYEPEHVSGKKTTPERERYRYVDIGGLCQYIRFIKRVVEIAEREIIITLSSRS